MPFIEIKKSDPHSRAGATVNVEPALTLARYKNGQTVIVLNRKLLSEMGWRRGNFVSVSLGTGSDEGWLELAPSLSGFKIGSSGSNVSAGKITCSNLFRGAPHVPSTNVKYTISNGCIYAAVPAVFRSAEKPNGISHTYEHRAAAE